MISVYEFTELLELAHFVVECISYVLHLGPKSPLDVVRSFVELIFDVHDESGEYFYVNNLRRLNLFLR